MTLAQQMYQYDGEILRLSRQKLTYKEYMKWVTSMNLKSVALENIIVEYDDDRSEVPSEVLFDVLQQVEILKV